MRKEQETDLYGKESMSRRICIRVGGVADYDGHVKDDCHGLSLA